MPESRQGPDVAVACLTDSAADLGEVLEALPGAVVGVDQGGVVRFLNRATEALFGYDRDDLIGELIEKLVPDSLRTAHLGQRKGYVTAAKTRPMADRLELVGRRHDGTAFPVEITLTHIGAGDALVVIAAITDLSCRDQGDHHERDLVAAIVKDSQDAIRTMGLDGIITSWNPAAEGTFGYPEEEIIGRSIMELTAKSRRQESRAIVARIHAGEPAEAVETVGVRKDGTPFPVSLTVSPLRDGSGPIIGAALIPRDISRQRCDDEPAHTIAASVKGSDDAMVTTSLDGTITSWNPAAERMSGYCAAEIIGKSVSILNPPDRAGESVAIMAMAAVGQRVEPTQTVRVAKDGTTRPVSLSVSPVRDEAGRIVGTFGVLHDVTEQKHASEVARAMAALVQFCGDAIIGTTVTGVITSWNPAAEAMYGYSSQEIIGKSVMLLTPESHLEQSQAMVATLLAEQATQNVETVAVGKNGKPFPVSLTMSSIRDHDGAIVGFSGIARDTTTSQQAFDAAQHLATIVENSHDAILSKTLDGIITSWNSAAERMYGYPSREIVGKPIFLLAPPDRVDEIKAILTHVRAGQSVDRLETIRHRADGSAITVSLTVSPIRDADGTLVGASTIARDVSELRQGFEAARSMIESSLDSLVAISPAGKITDANAATVKVSGIGREELIGTSFSDYFTEPSKAKALCQQAVDGGSALNCPLTMRHRDGRQTEVLCNASVHRDGAGKVLGVFAAARDVTAQNQAADSARRLAAAEELVHMVMATSSIGIALADMDGSFRIVNASLRALVGYDEAWFLKHRIDDIVHPDDLKDIVKRRARGLAGTNDTQALQLRFVRADGETIWVRRLAVVVPGGDGQPDLVMVHIEDITSEHAAQEELTYQAFHDPLTALHNRAWILDILQVDLRAAKRLGTRLGTLFVDLDNFKVVNDSLGHAAGDEVLAVVAERIRAALRPNDRVGRFGGDEFVIVLQGVTNILDLEQCAQRVSASIAADLHVHGHRIVPSASIGIAVSNPASTPDSLLRGADIALFRAKAAGRARWQFFDNAMHTEAVARLTVEDQLRDAITGRQFVVHYQPIVALSDAHVVGHEALIRWNHPTRGLLSPGQFLDVAEHTGLIIAIGAYVMDQACETLVHRPHLPGPISVNVSAVQLADPHWLSGVQNMLTRHGVDPARIVIEVTETAVLSLVDSAYHSLEALRRLGMGIHVDDFGTGYSSISVLRDLPVTGVKLDLRFVHDLTSVDSQANALAQGLSGLVFGMHLTGIAEGVETKMQADILLEQGWQCGQGYYFGRPAPLPVSGALVSVARDPAAGLRAQS